MAYDDSVPPAHATQGLIPTPHIHCSLLPTPSATKSSIYSIVVHAIIVELNTVSYNFQSPQVQRIVRIR